jgi:type VI secretion system protein ImpG
VEQRFLDLYNQELQFLREQGAEFAETHPKIAARLGLEGTECADPYVERLLEGFAFLTARVQLKLDARYPVFTQQLLEYVYPGFLAPVPACAIVEFHPNLQEGALQAGITIPRNSALRTRLGKRERTACEFRTAQDVTLWPVRIVDASYIVGGGSANGLSPESAGRVRAALKLRLESTNGLPLASLPIDSLALYLKGSAPFVSRLYEALTLHTMGIDVRATDSSAISACRHGRARPLGFDDREALLPVPSNGFAPFRLLQEYFALPERFHFVALEGLGEALRNTRGSSCDVMVLLSQMDPTLDRAVDASHIRLNCSPVVNLFPKSLDRLTISPFQTEYHMVVDRNRPLDFEIASVRKVTRIGQGGERLREIAPLYQTRHSDAQEDRSSAYTIHRRPRIVSTRAERTGGRTRYLGTECYLALALPSGPQADRAIRHLDIEAMCTNRDLPILYGFGSGTSDLDLDGAAPVDSIRCISGPTHPRLAPGLSDAAWSLINHLAVNLLSLSHPGPDDGAALLRRFLLLHANPDDAAAVRQIDAIRGVDHRPVIRRLPGAGPIAFGRGLAVEVTVDDGGFEGGSAIVLGAVLERFLARYASINAFTILQLQSLKRGLLCEWPARSGTRALL